MKLIFHPLVRRDLHEILDYYDQRSDTAGDRLFVAFEAAVRKIKDRPTEFHPLDPTRRRCNLAKFPYHLVFEVAGDSILITVLRHHKRRPSFGMWRKWD